MAKTVLPIVVGTLALGVPTGEAYVQRFGLSIPTAVSRKSRAECTSVVKDYVETHPPYMTRVEPDFTIGSVDDASEWIDIIDALVSGDEACFLTCWTLNEGTVIGLSTKYTGPIIPYGERGLESRILVEWSRSLCAPNIRGHPGFARVWDFGGEGCVLPRDHADQIYRWTNLESLRADDLADIFHALKFYFAWIHGDEWGGEDAIWIISYKYTAEDLFNRLRDRALVTSRFAIKYDAQPARSFLDRPNSSRTWRK